MKVLLINGSPHAHGCTYTALCEVDKALRAQGVETELVGIGAGAIAGCNACGFCKTHGKCVIEGDAVNALAEKFPAIDGLVVGAPVYFGSPNGSLISLLDRAFYVGRAGLRHKPAAAVVSARRAGTTASFEVLCKYFTINEMPLVSGNYWNMVHGNTPEEVLQDLEGLQTMRSVGRNMAWLLHCIEAGKQAGVQPPVIEP
ncbi:MAG: flavodoxin family protein, partial [Oscillospiraceae bacterium]